jgi:glycosyltransferase involved in cell wall biosynthesis
MTDSDRKLRILFVTSDKYPPFRPAARVIFGEEFVARGHVIDWLIQAERDCDASFEITYGLGTAYIAATDDGDSRRLRFRKHLLDFLNDLKMFRLVRRNRYDLIQVKDKYLAALLAILASKKGKTRFAYWLAFPHAEASLLEAREGTARYRYFYLLRGLFFKLLLYKIILPAADHIFVQSAQMKKDIAEKGIPLSKLTPVPGSLSLSDIPYSQQSEPASPRHDDSKHIVYLGTLMRTRRLDFLIRVHARVVRSHPGALLYFLGKGEMPEDEKLLIAEAERLGIRDSIIFTGFLPMIKAWEYIRNADVCLSPYYPTPILNSTSPTKLIEYMAMGKAVVGNDHPEQSLVIEESGAGLCAPWDEDAFTDAINMLLDNPSLAHEMGLKGRSYVERHRTNHVMAKTVEEQYYSVCDKHVLLASRNVNDSC